MSQKAIYWIDNCGVEFYCEPLTWQMEDETQKGLYNTAICFEQSIEPTMNVYVNLHYTSSTPSEQEVAISLLLRAELIKMGVPTDRILIRYSVTSKTRFLEYDEYPTRVIVAGMY